MGRTKKICLNRYALRRERSLGFTKPGNIYTMYPFVEEQWLNYTVNVAPLGGIIAPPWGVISGTASRVNPLGQLMLGESAGGIPANANLNIVQPSSGSFPLDFTKPARINWQAQFNVGTANNDVGGFYGNNVNFTGGVKLIVIAGVLTLQVLDYTGAVVFTQNLTYTFGGGVFVQVEQDYDGKGNMVVSCNVNGTQTLAQRQFVTTQNIGLPTNNQIQIQGTVVTDAVTLNAIQIGPVSLHGFHT